LDTCQSIINWGFAFWAPTYLTRYSIAETPEQAALALLPAILGFVVGAVLGGILIDRLRHRTPLAPAWVSLVAMAGGLVLAALVFSLNTLVPLMAAAFCLGVVTYMVQPAVNVVLFSVVPPEMKATTISASNVILNLAVAVVSISVGVVSDAAGLLKEEGVLQSAEEVARVESEIALTHLRRASPSGEAGEALNEIVSKLTRRQS
jgi:MFS family permease